MWPQALQMTRDECRGILRRLELESYSQVISVFRAQGGLSDAKAKLLEELRGIFHISNERHRAEARRVANDEQLATIAEAISGPNTWQEWSREGRRPYPMLPRVAPQTALALIANNVAEEAAQENLKLPYPAETAEVVKEDQQQIENQKSLEAVSERTNYVVTNDPFKMPEIPSNHKKNLKRNISSDHQNSGLPKKRSAVDSVGQQNIIQTGRKHYPHITANSPQINNSSSMSNMNERKQKQSPLDMQNNQHILKQRFFHQQHQITKQKMAKKAAAAAAAAASTAAYSGSNPQKRQATPAKSGRRANQKIQQQQKQISKKQLQVDGQQQQQMQMDLTGNPVPNAPSVLTQQQIDMQFVTYATHHQPPQQIFMEKDMELNQTQLASLPVGSVTTTGVPMTLSTPLNPPSLITPLSLPQMAISKRDISKNASKLHQNQQLASHVSPSLPSTASVPSQDLQTGLSNILSSSTTSTQISSDKCKSSEKSLITTTPVQKYIVEERQPGAGAIVNLQNSHGPTSSTTTATTSHIIQVSNSGQHPQIMSLPQFSAAATKLRAVNTTLIAPGAKITSTPTKKISSSLSSATSTVGNSSNSSINAGALHELANVASTQSQVLHIVDDGAHNNPTNAPHPTPLHTPPAVIQIHNTTGVSASTTSDISTVTNQSKVLTTKILPLVLTGSGTQNSANSSIINNSALVVASSPASSVNITPTTSTAGGTTIIKNLPSTMVLNTSTANLTPITVTSTNNTIISTLGAASPLFRKTPNIIKTASVTPAKSTLVSSAPHIISNVKLTPVSVSPSSTVTHITTPSTFKNVIPSTSGVVRTNVKLCQSPNVGNVKVFIQPSNLVDGSKMKFGTNSVSHKIISSSSNAPNSSKTAGSGQRVAIQKVQIIPAGMGSPAGGNVIQCAGGNHLNTKTGKSNMIFMPTSVSNVRPVTLSKMGNNILFKSSANQQITPTSPTTTISADNTIAKSNIVVLGPSLSTPVKEQNVKLENTQLINEDTPLDILNMPIVMDPGVSVTSPSSAAETVTVLPSNIIDTSNVNTASALATPIILDQTQLNPSKTVVLNVDWEMKLDIEQQNQYNNKNLKQKRTLSSSSSNQPISPSISSHGTKIKKLNNDLISLEVKPKESPNSTIVSCATSTTLPITTANSTKNMIVLDDSFDDVIVEEHDDDSSSITSVDRNQQRQNQNIDNDTPKILDMQIYQQHDGHDNKLADLKSTKINSDDDIVVVEGSDNEKQQSRTFLQTEKLSRTDNIEQEREIIHNEPQNDPQQLQHSECEIDAGFDETIVTEIDENTAIEYIEEEGVNTNASTLNDKNNMQLGTSLINDSATTIPTTVISSQDDTKSSNILTISSNDYTLSTTSAEQLITTDSTKANENLSFNATTVTTNATQEIIANNSATQQVEP